MKKRFIAICIVSNLLIANACLASQVDDLMGYTDENKAVMGAIWLGIIGYGLKKMTENPSSSSDDKYEDSNDGNNKYLNSRVINSSSGIRWAGRVTGYDDNTEKYIIEITHGKKYECGSYYMSKSQFKESNAYSASTLFPCKK